MKDSWFIVPCYNEARRLPVAAVQEFLSDSEPHIKLLFVDDGSTDTTSDVLNSLVEEQPERCQWMKLAKNCGKAEAVRQGIVAALEWDAAIVGYWDADLATPLAQIPDFVGRLQEKPELECILGSRVQILGSAIQRSPHRHYLGRVFATTVSLALGLSVYDSQCGAKAFRVTENTREVFAEPFRTSWIFDVELLGRYLSIYRRQQPNPENQRFCEFPLPQWRDVAGSKLRPRHAFQAAFQMADLYWSTLRHLPPSS